MAAKFLSTQEESALKGSRLPVKIGISGINAAAQVEVAHVFLMSAGTREAAAPSLERSLIVTGDIERLSGRPPRALRDNLARLLA